MADLQHAPRQPAPDSVVSDVLASIRRLIAQDGRQMPGRPLHDQPLMTAGDEPLVLGHDDLIAPDTQPPEGVRLQLVSVADVPDLQHGDPWQPRMIADWPPTPVAQPEPGFAFTVAMDDTEPTEPELTPEEEAEFAEACAALSRMTTRAPDAAAAMPAPPHQPHADPEPEHVATDAVQAQPGPMPDRSVNLFAELPVAPDSALRELIRDAIRAELQGEMGDRLSRNIRAMIRIEVESIIRELCAEA